MPLSGNLPRVLLLSRGWWEMWCHERSRNDDQGRSCRCDPSRGGVVARRFGPDGRKHSRTHVRRARRWRERQDLGVRSEENTSELQSLMSISYAVLCLKKKKDEKDAKQEEDK